MAVLVLSGSKRMLSRFTKTFVECRPSWFFLAVVVLIAIAVGRIALTYQVFTQTYDEPLHIACGMRWLYGTFTSCLEHPPLARVAVALPLYLDGVRPSRLEARTDEGNAILHNRNTYMRTLTLARLGILPFFVIASVVVWLWTRSLFGELSALLAVLLFTSLPPVLAHSGLATTDMPLAALFLCALYVFTVWLRQSNLLRSLVFGFTLGLAALSKFSIFVFLPACVLTLLASLWLTERPALKTVTSAIRRRTKPLIVSLTLALAVIWAGYRFSATPVTAPDNRPHRVVRLLGIDSLLSEKSRLRELTYALVEAPIPASKLFEGIRIVWEHNAGGHEAYLLSENRRDGWWYFFIIALAVKTPSHSSSSSVSVSCVFYDT